MKNPLSLITNVFTPERILLELDTFIIAFGITGQGENNLAMRWMGETEAAKGFPLSQNNPVWFIIHQDLMKILILSLINSSLDAVDKEALIDTLKEIYLDK